MPDTLGRYSLSEMEGFVKRELNDLTLTVNGSGVETAGPVQTTQFYSNTDIDFALNSSMQKAFAEMIIDHEDLFAQTTYITIAANRIGPYALPFNLLMLRWLKMKPASLTLQNVRPEDWQPMVYYDEDLSQGIQHQFGGPTYRLEGDNIMLNSLPVQENSNGMMVNSIMLPPKLVKPADVVVLPFALLIQDYMIYDAAVHIGETREQQASQEIKDNRQRAHDLLMAAVSNTIKPPSVQIYSPRLVKRTYSGRWGR